MSDAIHVKLRPYNDERTVEYIMTNTETVKPADAALLREIARDLERVALWNRNADVSIPEVARLRALADVLEKITPRVVRRIQKEWEDGLDAADSMDTSPNDEAFEFMRAADALLSLLTPEQRAEVDVIANDEL